MNQQAERDESSQPAHLRLAHYAQLAHWRDAGRRTVMLSACAIPGHLLMGAAKIAILIGDFSAFLTANILFTLGQAVVKFWVVRAARDDPSGRGEPSVRAYRAAAVLLLCLSVAYLVSCLPMAFGAEQSASYTKPMAIGIATISFVELGTALAGLLASRRRGDVLTETVNLTSLAAALTLMVLTQTAVLSFAEAGVDHSQVNGRWGAGVGALTSVIALGMLWRAGPLRARGSAE